MNVCVRVCLLCHLMSEPLPESVSRAGIAAEEQRALAFFFLGQYTAMNDRLARAVARAACAKHAEAGAVFEQLLEDVMRGAL